MHTYSGNKCEGKFIFQYIPKNYDLAIFDFPGCGNSQGEFITYGITEKYDIDSCLKVLDLEHEYQEYFLWGRSMGAVVAIFYAQLFLSPQSIKQFEEVKQKGNKKKVIKRKNSVYKTQYVKDKNGKNFKQVLRLDYDEHGIYIPKKKIPNNIWKNKVRAMTLDSPFTDLFSMLQSENFLL